MIHWPPRVGDYVRIAASGELGLVVEAAGHDDDPRFLVRVYPEAETASPRTRALIATSALHIVHRLHELEPDPSPSPREDESGAEPSPAAPP